MLRKRRSKSIAPACTRPSGCSRFSTVSCRRSHLRPWSFIAVLVAAATAIKQFLMLTNTMLVSYVSQSIARDIRGRIFDKSLSLDRPAFDSQGISGFTAHITHTTDMLATGITNFYGGAVTEPLRIFACLLRRVDDFLAADAGVADFRPAGGVSDPVSSTGRSARFRLQILDRSMGFHHVMLEVFNSLLTVQANTMEDFERDRFRESTSAYPPHFA